MISRYRDITDGIKIAEEDFETLASLSQKISKAEADEQKTDT